MKQEQQAVEILRAMAYAAAAGNSLTIAEDWDFGTATLIDQEGSHTHFGSDSNGSEENNFASFVEGLHGLLVGSRGMSWVAPTARPAEGK